MTKVLEYKAGLPDKYIAMCSLVMMIQIAVLVAYEMLFHLMYKLWDF